MILKTNTLYISELHYLIGLGKIDSVFFPRVVYELSLCMEFR